MSEVPATTGNAAPAAPTPLSPAEWRAQLEAQAEERRARVRAAEKEREAEQARRYAAANPAAAPDVQDRRRQERQESARRVAESLAERRRLLAELSGAGEACAETAVVETVGDYVETLVVAPVSHPDVQAPKAATQRAPAIPVVVPATRTWRPLAIVHPSRAQRASPSFPDALGMARPERTAHAAHSG